MMAPRYNRAIAPARARTVALRNIRLRALARERERYPESIERPKTRGECMSCPTCQEWRDAHQHRAKAGSARPLSCVEEGDARIVPYAGISNLETDDSAMPEPTACAVQGLRRSGDHGMRSVGHVPSIHKGHGATSEQPALDRTEKQRRQLQPGELRVGSAGYPESKQAIQRTANGEWPHHAHGRLGKRAGGSRLHNPSPSEGGLERLACGHTTGEAIMHSRPCIFVACKYGLYLDVNRGAIKTNFPGREPEDMVESCALDIADRGPHTLEEIAPILNLVRERVRQIEQIAKRRLRLYSPVAREVAET